MNHAVDLDTGQVLRPAELPAYLAHPANAGRLVRVIGVASFSPPADRLGNGRGTPGGRCTAGPQASTHPEDN